MNHDGYTAAEALGALAIIGMAVGGVGAGLTTLGKVQAAVRADLDQGARLRVRQDALDALLADRGPFRADQPIEFFGDERAFSFDCGQSAPCGANLEGADLTLRSPSGPRTIAWPKGEPLRFVYSSAKGTYGRWPPSQSDPLRPEHLIAVSAVTSDGGVGPTATTALIIGQPVGCLYDVVIRDCRGALP